MQLENLKRCKFVKKFRKLHKRKFETVIFHDTRLNKLHQIKDGEKDFFLT